jgi:hypothetical protein
VRIVNTFSLKNVLAWTPAAACRCGKRTLLQFPQTAVAQKTELRAAFLRQEVATFWRKNRFCENTPRAG